MRFDIFDTFHLRVVCVLGHFVLKLMFIVISLQEIGLDEVERDITEILQKWPPTESTYDCRSYHDPLMVNADGSLGKSNHILSYR